MVRHMQDAGRRNIPGRIAFIICPYNLLYLSNSRTVKFWKSFREAKISADRLFDLQLAYPIEHEKLRNIEAEAGDIDFVGVQFRYDLNRPVFKDLNLKIKSGKCTAITGGNGSGK